MSRAPRISGRARLLFLAHNLPHPPHEGALIRSYHTLRLLSQEFDVTALHFFRRGTHPSETQRVAALEALGPFGSAAAFPIPQEFSRARLAWDHVRSVLTDTAYTRWVHDSQAFGAALRKATSETAFDLVHVDSIDLMAYLPDLPRVPVVLAHHNVESALLRRRADNERGLKARYVRHQARLVEAAEGEWCRRVDLNVAVSAEDEEALRRLVPEAEFLVVPNGVDTKAFVPTGGEPHGGIVFVGGHSWFPNADGMAFFSADILPLIRARRPQTRVRWVGKIPERAARDFAAAGIEALGYVDDIRPVVGGAECVIVPLRIGGGTRLKILDAWAMGKAIVSTSIGSEGLDARDGENILLADTAEAFASATLRVLDDRDLRRRLESRARETAVRMYDWDALGRVVLARYHMLLASREATSSERVMETSVDIGRARREDRGDDLLP